MLSLEEIRHELHRFPELSGEEEKTAKRILAWIKQCGPTGIIDNIGGYGLAAIYDSHCDGPTILFRCELDALPIFETGNSVYKSSHNGVAHLCGHDGHMAILIGLARKLHTNPLVRGKVILLFQPAEETGAGARRIIADPKFATIKPDYSFALHNLPGMPIGEIGVKSGAFNFASEGIAAKLEGRTSHASHPEDAISPTHAVSELIKALPKLPARLGYTHNESLVTICHAQLGEPAFGITPGSAKLYATVRSVSDALQSEVMAATENMIRAIADTENLELHIVRSEKFAACTNDIEATDTIKKAAAALIIDMEPMTQPFRWSEDFGLFGSVSKAALFVLGAGERGPQLHAPDYDFPDSIIETGTRLFNEIASHYCR